MSTTRISFNGTVTPSVGRNGAYNTTGLSLFRIYSPQVHATPEDGYIQLRGVTSKDQEAAGYIAIPRDEKTLLELAEYFTNEAESVKEQTEADFLRRMAG